MQIAGMTLRFVAVINIDEKRHFGMWLSRRALNRQAKALRDVTSAAAKIIRTWRR